MAPSPSTLPAYVPVIVILGNLVALAATVFVFRRAGGRARPVALALVTWFLVDLGLALAGFFEGLLVGRAPRILVGFVVPLGLAFAALASEEVRELAARMDLRWLVGVQTYRAVGGVFLVAAGAGVLPTAFAGPAGWGDLLVGVTAPVAGWLALRGRAGWWTAAAWNTVGLADLAMAFTLGNLGGSHVGNVLGAIPTTEALTQYPLVLVPTFMVPVSIFLHLLTYVRLNDELGRSAGQASASASERVPRAGRGEAS